MFEKLKSGFEFNMNIKYSLAQGLYWMIYCTALSMASAFLTQKGYSTGAIGVCLAFVYLIAICIQQVISIYVDKSTTISVLEVIDVLSIVLLISLFFSARAEGTCFSSIFWFFVGAVAITVMQPFLNALNFHIEKYDYNMNFGLARGMGSFFFFLSSLIAGSLMNNISANAVPVFGCIMTLIYTLDIFVIQYDLHNSKKTVVEQKYDPFEGDKDAESLDFNTIKQFINKYKMFFVFLLGIVAFYFGHMVVNNFLYQIVVDCGGDAATNGRALALQAIVELPCMFGFKWLHDRFGSKILLSVSAIFFFFKILITAMATTVGMLYFSMLFQSLSFALFIPGCVTLVDEIMDEHDAVKGQSFVTISMTISNLLASLIAGFIIGGFGSKAALWFGTIVTLVGVIISVFALFRIKIKN